MLDAAGSAATCCAVVAYPGFLAHMTAVAALASVCVVCGCWLRSCVVLQESIVCVNGVVVQQTAAPSVIDDEGRSRGLHSAVSTTAPVRTPRQSAVH